MNFNQKVWLSDIEIKLKKTYCNNLLFIGLQGSYARGEAQKNSDIDLVIILDTISLEDLKKYKKLLKSMPYYEKSCGFISGKNEIQNWSKEDLFQFFYGTKNIYGKIEDIITPPSTDEIKKSNKQALENLYHAAVHSYLHSGNLQDALVTLYKTTFFILQAKYFLQNGVYIRTKQELLSKLSGSDREILAASIHKPDTREELLLEKLITWIQYQLNMEEV